MLSCVLASGSANSTNDELHDDHTGSTPDQDRATSNLLNHDERGRSREHVDKGCNKRDQEGVADRAKLLEKDRTEVEDEVDTSELLHHLHADTEHSAAEVGGGAGDAALEASFPRSEVAGLGDNSHLVLVVGDNLGKLILNVLRVQRLTTDATESGSSLVELALLDPVTGRLGQQSKTDGENDSPEELDSDRDTVGASVAAVLGSVNNAVGEQNTDGNAELVASNDGTANLLGSDLRHVPMGISVHSLAQAEVQLTE